MVDTQISLPFFNSLSSSNYLERLVDLLESDLDFHDQASNYASHNFHSFPAKFPPQLPRLFINSLTEPGDLVLDPMSGSGTTVLEASLSGRAGIGFDIDPLAIMLSNVKTSSVLKVQISHWVEKVISAARQSVLSDKDSLYDEIAATYDSQTLEFIRFWFTPDVQVELFSLIKEIQKIPDLPVRSFFELAFSAIIITKSGGVSLALDLAHTRPHRAKLVYSRDSEVVEGREFVENPTPHIKHATKYLKSPLDEFSKRVQLNLRGLSQGEEADTTSTFVSYGNAQSLPLRDNSIDLIVTSPPYASNAIDYMRAHKFSLVWFGYPIDTLSDRRRGYIGSDYLQQFPFEELPSDTSALLSEISALDKNKGLVLHRYYSEMKRALREMYRVLKPGKSSIVVVGSSIMRGKDTNTHRCLAEIGKAFGFQVPLIGIRNLDRDRRMMPAGFKINKESQIQQRMHEEYVIGFYKPS